MGGPRAGSGAAALLDVLAHYHGQTWNAAGLARGLGVSESTAAAISNLLTDGS